MELNPETVLHNRYRIIRPLGKGGMGAVYLAFDATLEHEVAVKSNLNPSQAATSQFLREARLLAKLRHPNLPRVIDHFIDNEQQFLVMDYIPGDDLGKLLEEKGRLPLDQVLKYAGQLGDALTYLHNQTPPVIHRDIKPGNIKLMSEETVILVDFGIAKSSDVSQATSTGASGFTPGYAPPEQYGGARTGPYSDQYSLAATLYQLLTGVRPVDSVQRLMGDAVLTPVHLLRPEIPAYIGYAIERSLSVKPEERFANVADFITALNTPSTPPTVPVSLPVSQPAPQKRKISPWVWVGGGLLLLFGMAVLVLVGLFALGGGFSPSPTDTAQPVAAEVSTSTAVMESPQPVVIPPTPTLLADLVTPLPAATWLPKTSPTPEVTATPEETATPQETATSESVALGNGKMIAFVSDRADGKTSQIWTMKISLSASNQMVTSDLTQNTFDSGNKSFPGWSPDGKFIIFSAPGPQGNGLDLWMLDPLDKNIAPIRLTNIKGDDSQAAWSPDGKFIAFTNHGLNQDLDQLFIMNADGSKMRKLSLDFEESNPAWSPDMKNLLYVIHATDHRYLYERSKTDSYTKPGPFDNTEVFGRLGEVTDPVFSPDGQFIAYTRNEGYAKQILSVNTASRGAKISLLTAGAFKEERPSWAPDGKWIVFTSQRDNNPEIYIMTSTGLMQTNLTNNPAKDSQPSWQP